MTRLTLEALAVLDAIDRRGSFAQAADELQRGRALAWWIDALRTLDGGLDALLVR